MTFRTSVLAAVCSLAGITFAQAAMAQECKPPRILVVLDASSSMNQKAEAMVPVTKWEAARQALQTVLSTYPADAQYGLMKFPGGGGQCSHGEVVVEVASDTPGQILQAMGAAPPSGGAYTPAGQSLMAASQHPAITDPAFDNYVVFVTDGYQYCDAEGGTSCATAADCAFMGVNQCPSCLPDSNDGCYCVRSWPVIGAEALAAQGVKTFVVGFGNSVDVLTLNQTADAGGTALANCDPNANTPSCYFQATAPAELTAALGQIMQQVLLTETCTGPCGLMGERTCTLDGWGDCDAPDGQSCVASCGNPGTQQCIDDMLTDCSSEAECGEGGAGGTSSGQGGATSAAGGSAAGGSAAGGSAAGGSAAGGNGPLDPEETGGCSCRTAGSADDEQAPLGAMALLGLALAAVRRRRRN